MMLRRRMMDGWGEEGSYIQDGLMLYLDGINRGTSDAKKWIDLVGGYEFVTADDNDATWGTNHLITPCEMRCPDYDKGNAAYGNQTFEIVFQENSGSVNSILYVSRKNKDNGLCFSFGFGRYSNNYLLCNYSAGRITLPLSSAPLGDTNYCFSFNANKLIIVNGSEKSAGAADFYSADNEAAKLALRGNGGKLFCIRQYNRNLTQEEIIHNQQVDNVRFKLGLNI